jgi:hypothetical protein
MIHKPSINSQEKWINSLRFISISSNHNWAGLLLFYLKNYRDLTQGLLQNQAVNLRSSMRASAG